MSRAAVAAALIAAVVVVGVMLLRGGDELSLHARFENAGQLVKGAEVRMAGHRVGTIGDITLTDNRQADIAFTVSDGAVLPLREGTHATIRQPGQASVAGRVIELTPGPASARELRDGAVLGTTRTTGIVDLDAVLNALDRPTRGDVRGLAANAAAVFAGSGAQGFNALLAELNPAAREARGIAGDLAADRQALRDVLRASANVTGALASRRDDLVEAVSSSGRAVTALARERRALNDTLALAPGTLARLRGTLHTVGSTATALRPTLRRAVPATVALRSLLREGGPALKQTAPALEQAAAITPPLIRAFRALGAAAPGLTKTLDLTRTTLTRAQPIVRGLRYYGTDFILGLFNGLAGNATGNYDANGHYIRLSFMTPPQGLAGGAFGDLLNDTDLLGQFKLRTGLNARCPGAAAPPAPDGSNPWVPEPSLCDPAHSTPASVNDP